MARSLQTAAAMRIDRLVLVMALASCSIPAKFQSGGGDDASGGTPDGGGAPADGGGIAIDAIGPTSIDGMESTGSGMLTLTLTAEPPALGNNPTATFDFSTSEPAAVQCRLDANAFADCPAPEKAFSGVPDGHHTFDLQAVAGSDQAAIPTYSFAIDTTGPALAITSPTYAISNVKAPTFTFTTDAATPGSVTCQIDGGNPQACASPDTLPSQADGQHTFTLRGSDALGNTSMASFIWTIDTVKPVVTITGHPSAPWSTVKTPSFTFTVSKPAATTCQLGAGGATACSSGVTLAALSDSASYTETIVATDAAGNTGQAAWAWGLDTTAPAVGTPAGNCANGTMTVTWSASDVTSGLSSTTSCSYGATSINCPIGTYSWSGNPQPNNTVFSVTYTDNAGNTKTASRAILTMTTGGVDLCD